MTVKFFPERLRQLRVQNNTKQNTLANHIHRSSCSISNYENGVYEPDLETLTLIADFYEVSTDYLLGRTDYPAVPAYLPKAIYGQYTVGRFLNLLKHLSASDRKALVYGLQVLEEARFPNKE